MSLWRMGGVRLWVVSSGTTHALGVFSVISNKFDSVRRSTPCPMYPSSSLPAVFGCGPSRSRSSSQNPLSRCQSLQQHLSSSHDDGREESVAFHSVDSISLELPLEDGSSASSKSHHSRSEVRRRFCRQDAFSECEEPEIPDGEGNGRENIPGTSPSLSQMDYKRDESRDLGDETSSDSHSGPHSEAPSASMGGLIEDRVIQNRKMFNYHADTFNTGPRKAVCIRYSRNCHSDTDITYRNSSDEDEYTSSLVRFLSGYSLNSIGQEKTFSSLGTRYLTSELYTDRSSNFSSYEESDPRPHEVIPDVEVILHGELSPQSSAADIEVNLIYFT